MVGNERVYHGPCFLARNRGIQDHRTCVGCITCCMLIKRMIRSFVENHYTGHGSGFQGFAVLPSEKIAVSVCFGLS